MNLTDLLRWSNRGSPIPITKNQHIHGLTRTTFAHEKWFKPSIHVSRKPTALWLTWVVIFEARFGYHGYPVLGKCPTKWRQQRDIILAVDWDVN